MRLTAYSLERIIFEGEVILLTCRTPEGELTILNHHRPLIATLAPGTLRIQDETEKDHYLPITGGFLEVDPQNTARLLVDEEK